MILSFSRAIALRWIRQHPISIYLVNIGPGKGLAPYGVTGSQRINMQIRLGILIFSHSKNGWEVDSNQGAILLTRIS